MVADSSFFLPAYEEGVKMSKMKDAELDLIELTRTVLFVGDYFSLMSTVVLSEELREPGEDDDDFAIRLASVLLKEHYGWDVADAATVSIGVVEE